jgi:hypothetical protein
MWIRLDLVKEKYEALKAKNDLAIENHRKQDAILKRNKYLYTIILQ